MEIFITKSVQTLLLPPGLMILLMLAGYYLARRWPGLGKFMIFSGFGLLVLGSLPIIAQFNMQLLENQAAPLPARPPTRPSTSADAIVILGGGRYFAAPEYHRHDTVSAATLERLRYGAWLHRWSKQPILVSGGNVFATTTRSEAELMHDVLVHELHVPVRWQEKVSRTTRENAEQVARLLGRAGIHRIYLVTHAWHMPRARMVFEAAGLKVVPAPLGFTRLTGETPWFIDLLPDSRALRAHDRFLHEIFGLIWYRLRY